MRSAERSDACCGLYGERFTAASSVNAKDAVYIYMFADCIYAIQCSQLLGNVIKRGYAGALDVCMSLAARLMHLTV